MVGGGAGRPRPVRHFPPRQTSRTCEIVAAEIRDRARVLAEHPLIGRPIEGRPEFRELVLDVLNARYVFRYATDGVRLVMLRVFHSRELRP
jgi:plasmid stabilization system protein ParE